MLALLRRNRSFFLPYAGLLLLLGALLLLTPKNAVFLFINRCYTPTLDVFFEGFTNVGDGVFYALVTLGLLFVRFRWALLSLLSFALTSLVAQVLKRLVFTGHPRPFRYFQENLPNLHLHLAQGAEAMNGLKSFPSGHSTSAFSLFCLLTLLARNKRWGYPLLLLAVSAAFSRVYLAQHFVEDVYAGSLLGTGLTTALASWLEPYLDRHPRAWHQWRLRGGWPLLARPAGGPTPPAAP